jgi:hypothetical protein
MFMSKKNPRRLAAVAAAAGIGFTSLLATPPMAAHAANTTCKTVALSAKRC